MKSKLVLFTSLTAMLFVLSCTLSPFGPKKAVYTVTVRSELHGAVAISPFNGRAYAGESVDVTAIPDTGYMFAGFYGDAQSIQNPFKVTPSNDMKLTARFVKKPQGNMAQILSAGQTFTMGLPGAGQTQTVKLTYNYFIDRYEVTQGLFKKLLGTNPSKDNATSAAFGIGDSFPVYYVTIYDAMRFCNARSKQEGYDTVYSFSALCASAGTCPYFLENLVVHYDRIGYRLPTEAEWEYACRAGSPSTYFWGDDVGTAGTYSWFTFNSQNVSHAVGTKSPNAFGLFDMTGNVSEWVSDWYNSYPDSLAIDPVGPNKLSQAEYEAKGTRIARGGCFELGTTELRSGNRDEPYPMPSSTSSKHIGFRTVLGCFFPDTSNKPSVINQDSIQVSLTCTKSDLISVVKTAACKIVFVKKDGERRKLCYIDFTEPLPAVREIKDSVSAYGPTISPNGSSVATSSMGLGFSTPSTISVRVMNDTSHACIRTQLSNPAYLPSWWVDTISLDTFIVYSSGASMNDAAIWNTQRTMKQRIQSLSFVESPSAITYDGSYHGGLSHSGQYIATGYPKAYFYDIRLNHRMQFFLPPYSGRTDTAQVCNVSITPSVDKPDEILLLDFGYSAKSTVVGKSYGFHSILFRCNSAVQMAGHVSAWYEVPKGYDEWNDVKWSNHPDYAIAVATTSDQKTKSSLFIINIKDSSYLKVADGIDVAEPCLWIDPKENSERPDPYHSFAKYNIPARGQTQILLSEKMKLFWKTRENLEVGVFGNSTAYFGVDPSVMTHKTINMAIPLGEGLLSETLAKQYFLLQAPHFKAFIMGLDAGFLDWDYNPQDPYYSGMYDSEGFQFDKQNNFWKNGLPSQIVQKINGFNSSLWPDFDSTGFLLNNMNGGFWGEASVQKGDYSFDSIFVQQNLSLLSQTADTLAAHGIHLIVVTYPESPDYKNTGSMGMYGPSIATYDSVSARLKSFEQKNPYFHFYDANNYGNHDYTAAEALHPNHLNRLGAQKLSRRLDSLVSLYVK